MLTDDHAADSDLPMLEIDIIRAIHRGHDGYVCFRADWPAGHSESPALRANELEMTGRLTDHLEQRVAIDGNYSINGFVKLKRRKRVSREAGHLRYLCACYVDFDGYCPVAWTPSRY